MAEELAGHPVERREITHRVMPAPAMDMHVDKTGRKVWLVTRHCVVEVDGRDPAVLDRDSASRDLIVEDETPRTVSDVKV